MRLLPLVLLASFAASAATPAHAKPHPPRGRSYRHSDITHPVSVGMYATLGGSTGAQPTGRYNGVQGTAGIFAEYARHAFRPGLDARAAGTFFGTFGGYDGGGTNNGTVGEKAIGPRFSYAHSFAHPYIEALFGQGNVSEIRQPDGSLAASSGVLKLGVAGIDFDVDTHVQLRLEYTAAQAGASNATGTAPAFLRQGVSTGFVFRFP